MPSTKQIESKIFDFPEPFKPVMALKWGSKLRVSEKETETDTEAEAASPADDGAYESVSVQDEWLISFGSHSSAEGNSFKRLDQKRLCFFAYSTSQSRDVGAPQPLTLRSRYDGHNS